MEFKCFSEWDKLPQSSDELFSQAEKDSLFFSRQWFENLVTTALESDQSMLLVCVVEKGDRNNTDNTDVESQSIETDSVLAILPLISRDNKEWTALHHIYTSLFTLLLVENNQQEIIDCLAKGLSQLPFDSLRLESIGGDDYNINSLHRAMEFNGLSCYRYTRFFNWYHQLKDQTFSDYMDARPSKVRNTIARKQRKLEREHVYEIRLHTGSEVKNAMADYHAIYKASWKATEQFDDVIEGFVDSFSKSAWTRLAILYIDEQPAAAQIWFVVHKKASIFKLAYDEAWKHYSPGSILTKYLMEYVIDTDKVEEIDFLTGNDRYKQDWMSDRRQRWRLVFKRNPEPEKKGDGFIQRIRNWLGK